MTQSTIIPSPKRIEQSPLIVDRENPLDTLPLISDALICMATFFQLEPTLDKSAKVEVGAGLILDLLAYAIEDVQEALEDCYRKPLKKDIS